jgi:hypothetical protein
MCLFAKRLEAQVFAAERIHGDDTTVPVLAKVKTVPGGFGPIYAMIVRSRTTGRRVLLLARSSQHPSRAASRRVNSLYALDRTPSLITEAGCWADARRKLFELADIASKARNRKQTTISPIAFEAAAKSMPSSCSSARSTASSPEASVAARRRHRTAGI